jgi:hypothetical protein
MDDEEVLVQHYSFIQGDMVDRNRQPEDLIMIRRSMISSKNSSDSEEKQNGEEDQGTKEGKEESPTSDEEGTVNNVYYY